MRQDHGRGHGGAPGELLRRALAEVERKHHEGDPAGWGTCSARWARAGRRWGRRSWRSPSCRR
ncbi:MAG: hypothetical protein AB1941_23210 [Gemmatimonadota bacterium]